MKTYYVAIPIAGSISIQVEAESPKAAKAAAWAKVEELGPEAGEVEWEFHEKIFSGNVCHVSLNEVQVDQA